MSWIVKLFTWMFAIVVSYRIIGIILSLLVVFIVYKAIVDPKYLTNILNFISGLFGGRSADVSGIKTIEGLVK